MAGNIKGIVIEIGGNTQPLEKALGDVNKKTRDLQGELKSVERLLKLDPKNTELLAQKQKLLSEQVDNSREKLERLKAAQEQVNQAFQRGDLGEEQYRHFSRQVINAEQELSKFEKQLKETGDSANSLGDKINAAGDKMKDVGAKMSVGITAPIVAGGAVMLKGAMDAEAAQGKLQAALGATAEDAEELGKVAIEVWKSGFGENIEEASTAVVMVKQNLLLAGDALTEFTKGAMTISDVFDQDVNEVIAASKTMVDNFGISGQEALDILTVGFQQGGDFSGELLDTLREYSPQFVSLGLSADQAMAMLIEGAKAGAWNLDKVGDAMKEFNIRAQDGSKTTADGFAAIGLNAQEMGSAIAAGGDQAQQAFMATIAALAAMEDPMAQNQAGVALFGTQWEDVRAQVITAMADGAKGLDDFKGANEEATRAVQENNPGLAFTKSIRGLQTTLLPVLTPIIDKVTELVNKFNEMDPSGQKVILVIAGIAAAIGPLLIVIGSLMTALPGLKIAFSALTGPIGIVIAAITGLTIAWKIWGDDVKKIVSDVVDSIEVLLGDLKEGVTEGLESFKKSWSDFGVQIKNIGNNLKDSLGSIWNGIKSAITNPIESAKQIVLGIITTIKNAFANMRITIPAPKLPHVSVSTKTKKVGGISVPYPDFDLNWYKTGAIFSKPSIIGVGEAGKEAVIPLDKLPGLIASALQDAIGGQQSSDKPIQLVVNLDGKVIANNLYNLQQTNARGRGLK